MELIWQSLDKEKALDIKKLLVPGGYISQFILDEILQLNFKGIEALVPDYSTEAEKYRFEWGIFKEPNKNNSILKLENLLVEEIHKNKKRTIIFENWKYEKRDLLVQKDPIDIPYFIYRDKLYFSFDNMLSMQYEIRDMVNWADQYPFLSVLINKRFIYQTGDVISDKDMKEIVDSMETAFVGAYDEESYVKINF